MHLPADLPSIHPPEAGHCPCGEHGARRGQDASVQKIQTHPKPLDEFGKTATEIGIVLEALKDANDDHYDLAPDAVTWANVGDAKRTLQALQEILDVIRGEVK